MRRQGRQEGHEQGAEQAEAALDDQPVHRIEAFI
jgi:hypothetical protein